MALDPGKECSKGYSAMTSPEALSLITTIEENREIACKNLMIGNVPLWNVVRSSLFSHLTGDFSMRYSNARSPKMLAKMASSFLDTRVPRPTDILAISSNSTRRDFEGSSFDIYVDWIGKLTDYSYSVIEIPNVSVPSSTNNAFTKRRISGMKLLAKSLIRSCRFQKQGDTMMEKVSGLLKDLLDTQTKDRFLGSFRSMISRYLALIHLMNDLLDRVKPKLILEVCSYNLSSRALTYAAKRRGIPVIEIQHGVINEYHAGYIYRHKIVEDDIPDGILVYGEAYKDILLKESTLFKPERIDVVGNYYIETVKNSPQVPEVEELRIKASGRPVALITTQPIYLAEAYSEAVVSLKKEGFFVIIKPHPSEHEDKYLSFRGERVFLSDISVFELLKIADVHLTISSTCAIDALQFSVPTIVLDYEDEQRHLRFLEGFSGILFQDASLSEAFDRCIDEKVNLTDDRFMANNSRERLTAVITRFLGESRRSDHLDHGN